MQNIKWQTKLKVFSIGIGVIVSLVLLVLAGASFWLSSDDGQRMIKAQINGAIPGTLSWENLNLSLYAGRIEFIKPRLQGPSGEELVSLDRIFLNLSWTALFRKNITAETVILETPQVWLATDANGDVNILKAFFAENSQDEPPDTDTDEFPFNLVIDDLTLTNGFFQYQLKDLSAPRQHLAIHEIGFSLTKGNFEKHSALFSLRSGKGAMEIPGIQTALESFRFDGHLHRGDLKDATIALGSKLATLNGAGNVGTIFSAPFFDIDVQLKSDLSELQRTIHIPTELTGLADLHLMMHGVIDNPEASLSLNYAGGDISGNRVDNIRLACHLKEKHFIFDKLDITAPLAQVTTTGEIDFKKAFKDGFTANTRDLDAIAYQLNLTQSGTLLEHLFGPDKKISGAVDATLTLKGMGISPETMSAKALLELSARNLAMVGILAPFDLTLKAQAEVKNQHITVPQLDLTSGKTRMKASGQYDLTSAAVGATLELTVPDLSKLMVPPVAGPLNGNATLHAEVSGSMQNPVVSARLLGKDLMAGGIPLGTLQLDASLDSAGQLAITDLTLANEGSYLQAEGSIQVVDTGSSPGFPSDMTVTFQNISPTDFLPSEDISGRLDGTLTWRGPLLSPSATLTLQGQSLAVRKQRVGDLDARLRLIQGLLLVDEVYVKNGKSDLTLSGTARILDAKTGSPVESPSLDVKLGGNGLFLEDFFEGMNGQLILNAYLKGDTSRPQGSLSLTGQDIDLGVQKIQAVDMTARIEKTRVTVDTLKGVLAPGEEIEAEGWLSLADQAYGLQVTSKGVSLEHIDAIGVKNAAKGNVALSVTGEGHLNTPRLKGEVTVTQLRLNSEAFKDSRLKLDLQNNIVSLKGDLVVALEGWFNLSTQDFFAKATLDQTRLAPFFHMINRDDLRGSVTGLVEAEGNAASAEKVRAVAEVSQLSVFHNDMELVSSGVFRASVDNGTLLVPGIRFTLFNQGHLTISGEGKLGGSLDFRADGALPLEVIHLFIDDLSGITGDMNLAAHLKGTLDRPDFKADISLNDIGLTLPVLEQRLHSINGQIQVTPDALTLKRLNGNLDKGRLDLSGALALTHFLPVSMNVRLKAHALPIMLPGTMETLLNGDLTFTGTSEASQITGTIIILEGRYYKDVTLGLIESIGRRRREVPPVTRAGPTPLLKNTQLNITLRHRAPFIVDNNMALMALKPTLKITGRLANPMVNGRAEVDSGFVSYLGKEFIINKGVVDFLNPYKIEATIDVESQVEIRKWVIHLKVSGVPENLNFKMSSTPQESDADIISLLVFNRTRREMIAGEGGANTSTKQLLADLVAKNFEGSLKDATGLDTIEMTYTERADKKDTDDVNITVGKELSKRITFNYGVGTKNGGTVQSAITEYKFFETVLMNAFRDTDGDFGGELMFRLELR